MNLRAKRKIELENQVEKRKEEVVAAAVEVFKQNGIENTKMTDIAQKAEVGVASVYRYFKAKPDLVIEAAIKLWKDEINILYSYYGSSEFKELSGLMQIKKALEVYIKLFEDHKDFVRFIEEFDNYIIREGVQPEKLEGYENTIVTLQSVVFDAAAAGVNDLTVRKDIDIHMFYDSVNHALMSLCQKLVLRGKILKSDYDIEAAAQIRLVIEMAVEFIKTK